MNDTTAQQTAPPLLQVETTALEGVVILTPRRFSDARGEFCETWNRRRMAEAGLDIDFVQDNRSLSVSAGTVRGLHFQAPPHAQAKLVRCGRGRLFDVAVDIRRGSPTFGQWVGVELTPENGRQILVPEGFLHGFVTRAPDTEILYKCSDYYAPDCDGAVRWDSCGIDWGLDGAPVLSDKDAAAPPLSDFDSPFTWEGA
nr:dTDP-4-dehydrorhamnose 3,5-epimerase [Roseovarius salinarum]